jgi:hypothetical protein
VSKSAEKERTRVSVERYNLREHRAERDELARLLAKITGRRITGTIELHLNQGTPGVMTSSEEQKGTE